VLNCFEIHSIENAVFYSLNDSAVAQVARNNRYVEKIVVAYYVAAVKF